MMKPRCWLAVVVSTALIGCQSPASVPPTATPGLPATVAQSATATTAPTVRPTETPTATPGAPPVPAGLGYESPIAPGEALDLPALHLRLTRVLRGAEAAAQVPAELRGGLGNSGWEGFYVEFTQSGICYTPTSTAGVNEGGLLPGADVYCPDASYVVAADPSRMAYTSQGILGADGKLFVYAGVGPLSLHETIGYFGSMPPDADLAYVVFPRVYEDSVPTSSSQGAEVRLWDALFLLDPGVDLKAHAIDAPNTAGSLFEQPAAIGETVITASWKITLTDLKRGEEAARAAEQQGYTGSNGSHPNLLATFNLVSQQSVWQPASVPTFLIGEGNPDERQYPNTYSPFGVNVIGLGAFPGAHLTVTVVDHVDDSRGPIYLSVFWFRTQLDGESDSAFERRYFVSAP